MLSISRVILALALCSAGVSAVQDLSLSVSTPEAVNGVDSLVVTTTLTNTGDETVKLLKDPNTILSALQTHSFDISSPAGKSPAFTGIKVKYSPNAVIAANKAESFVVLAPGESVSLDHSLAGVYNFTSLGEGKFDLAPKNTFRIVSEDNTLSTVHATTTSSVASLSGKLASLGKRSNMRRSLGKRAVSFNGCSSSRQTLISTAASNAVTYASNAASYLSGISSGTTRFTTWFGTYTSAHKSTVLSHYTKIGTDPTSSTYDCTCTDTDTYAYVYPDTPGYVYLCGAFWSAPATGTDSKAGTIVHEQSHFTVNGGTDDHVYGQTACKALAKSDSAEAIDNADSHEYFAENNPSLS